MKFSYPNRHLKSMRKDCENYIQKMLNGLQTTDINSIKTFLNLYVKVWIIFCCNLVYNKYFYT